MDPECVKPLIPAEYKPGIFEPLGIFRKDNGFVCLICNRFLTTLPGGVGHSKGQQHCERFEKIKNSFTNVAGRIACKFCTSYRAADWKSFLIHFYSKNHLQDLEIVQSKASNKHPRGSSVTYPVLLMNQIMEVDPGSYFCCCCAEFMFNGWSTIVDHIQAYKHKDLQKTHKEDDNLDTKKAESRSQKLVRSFVSHVSYSNYYCYLCDCVISGQSTCLKHIKGFDHTNNIMKKGNINYLPLSKKVVKNKRVVQKITKVVQDVVPKSLAEPIQAKYVTGPSRTGTYYCKLCNCTCPALWHITQHISGKRHTDLMKQAGRESKTVTAGKKTSASSSVSGLTSKKQSSVSINPKNDVRTTTQKAVPEPREPRLLKISESLIPLISKHLMHHQEKEIYCPACKAQIKDPQNLVTHVVSREHIAEFSSYKAKVAQMNKNLADTSEKAQKAPHRGVAKTRTGFELNRETRINEMEPNLRRYSSISDYITDLEKSVNKLSIVEVKEVNSTGGKGNEIQQQDVIKSGKKVPQNRKRDRSKKQKKPQAQNNNRINRRGFDPKYLKVDMQHIYEVTPEKMRLMKLSCQLCFPKTSTEIYCLICERSVASDSQNFYDHICSTAHTKYLAQAEQDDKCFIPYPEQFSDLSLAEECMQQTSVEKTIQCLLCDETIENNDALISEHIKQDSHKEGKQDWNKAMEEILQDTLAKTESTWYNIQTYWCQPCDMQCNTEFHFAEHIDTRKHNRSIQKLGTSRNKLVYDACIPCATLWLGHSSLYTEHCNHPMHKYLLQSGDYSICKLPDQVKTVLEHSQAEVNKMVELSDQVLTVQKVKADDLLKCLEDTVKPAFPEAKAYPFGSRVSGLGFPDSDIDVFLDCGTYDGTKYKEDSQMKIIMSVGDCLYTNQRLWEIEEILTSSRTPIIKLRHRATELSCDISFKNGLSVENTKLLKCFMDNYPLCRKLMLFLKKWLYLCNLSGSQHITNYALCWYVIFYLQSKSILPSVASMIAKENKSKIIDGWETGICETFDTRFDTSRQEFTFTELLQGFFVFYTNFDYRYSVACPIIGSTIPKQDFTEIHLLPKEMVPYVNHIKTKSLDGPVELFRIDSEMCIQDPYDLSHNLTKAVRKFTLNRFIRLCAASADVLNKFKHQ